MIFEATYEYQSIDTPPMRAKGNSVIYKADSLYEAICAFNRWWEKRHQSFPDYFSKLLAVKICRFEPEYISDDGNMPCPRGLTNFEWKCDFSLSLLEASNGYRLDQKK